MPRHPHSLAYLALLAVCFFWGTTYLGIRMSLEMFPPVTLVAARYLLSGTIMLVFLTLKGVALPRGRELWWTALNGLVLLGGGNGALTIAEQWVPSGLAALIITLSPFWMVGLEAVIPGGERPRWPTLVGLAVGLLGVLLLLSPGNDATSHQTPLLLGFVVLQAGCLCWSLGSVLQKRLPTQATPVMGGAIQQLAVGISFGVAALVMPHAPLHHNPRSIAAMAYLVVFGSLVGYSAYVYALAHLPVRVVSLYTYINPVVAVFLGWLFYREPLGWRELVAMVVIFAGVAIVKQFGHAPRPESQEAEPVPATGE